MDVIKTLLAYMTVLLTSSAAMAPGLSPLPAPARTPAPVVAVVSQAPAAPVTAPPTLAPQTSPTAAPVLTTVRMNDKGQNVRNLQIRLKELGYLAGKVDGAFGRETLAAVQAFQRANGLEADGIAGQKTLNKLYFDQQVVWAASAGRTPAPVVTPSPTPVLGSLPVYYLSTTGERLYTEVLTLYQGRTTIRANSSRVPQGYVLTGTSQVTVTVSGNGIPSPPSVSFTYQKQSSAAPVTAQLKVNYLDENGNASLRQETLTLPLGITQVYANDRLVPQGYVLTSVRSVPVTVNAQGVPTPGAISFVYRKAPVTVMLPVNYLDENGEVLYNDQLTLESGSHDILANSGHVPLGYTLVGSSTQQVKVDKKGNAVPPAITFVYAPPQGASVPVSYLDMDGGILHEELLTLPQGSHAVEAKQEFVPEGYRLQGLSTITVMVDYNGNAVPPSVTFHYLMPETQAEEAAPPAQEEEPRQEESPAAPEQTDKLPDASAAPETGETEKTDEADADAAAPEEKPDPAKQEEIPYLPAFSKVSFAPGEYPVYTGPGEQYLRVEEAVFQGGEARLYGMIDGWMLVGFGTDEAGYRIGYIAREALPEDIVPAELVFASASVTLTGEAPITDEPLVNLAPFATLPAGAVVRVLALFEENSPMAYVEAEGLAEDRPARGFIRQNLLP